LVILNGTFPEVAAQGHKLSAGRWPIVENIRYVEGTPVIPLGSDTLLNNYIEKISSALKSTPKGQR